MKRFHVIIALVCLAIVTISFAAAQENVSPTEPVTTSPTPAQSLTTEPATTAPQNVTITDLDLFTWANTTPPDWGRGVLFAVLGLIGALVAMFGLIGGAVPGTAGQAIIEADTVRLKGEMDRLDELIKSDKCEPECIKAVATAVNDFRDDISAEKWHQCTLAFPIYVVLGTFFASMLAVNMLQAILIGFGWTGVIGTLGLKSDSMYRKSVKDDEMDELRSEIIKWKNRALKPETNIADVDKEIVEWKKKAEPLKTAQKTAYYVARKL